MAGYKEVLVDVVNQRLDDLAIEAQTALSIGGQTLVNNYESQKILLKAFRLGMVLGSVVSREDLELLDEAPLRRTASLSEELLTLGGI